MAYYEEAVNLKKEHHYMMMLASAYPHMTEEDRKNIMDQLRPDVPVNYDSEWNKLKNLSRKQ